MTLWHAFICLIFFAGCCSIAYLIGSFLHFHHRHRRMRNVRRTYGERPVADERDWQARFEEEMKR
jgi:hypothetical protein